MRLTEHFTLEELTRSATAEIERIDNTPDKTSTDNLEILARNVLEPARQELKRPLIINSGYRSATLNKAVGGKTNSYHLTGQAADIHSSSDEESRQLAEVLQRQKLADLIIIEKRGRKRWVHVQWSYAPRHRTIRDER